MIITAGTVQLRSGSWQWELLGGARVRWLHYVMVGAGDNQMIRPLVTEATVDNATAARFASHPGTRVWVSASGEICMIHDLSYLARWRPLGPRELIVIDEAGESHRLEVSDSLEVGLLDDVEVTALIEAARRGDGPRAPE